MHKIESRRGWGAVAAVAAATFTVVTSEMLPVGVLTSLGRALGVTDGTAGLALTVTGLVAAVSAPLLTPLLGTLDRRTALCGLALLVATGNLLAAWSPSFAVMVVARVLVGLGMGGVWTIAAGLGPRLRPTAPGPATSLIFSGVAVASVVGVPSGTYLGEVLGWRAAFAVAGGVALLVAGTMAVALPALPVERSARLGGTLQLARRPAVATGLVVVALLVTGHFAAYTYVRPVLEHVSGAGAGAIAALLLLYGVAGIVGNFAGGAVAARSPHAALLVVAGGLAVVLGLVPVLGTSVFGAAVLLVGWGLAYGAVSVSSQSWVLSAAPDAGEPASSLLVGVFNGAIALGAFTGGVAADAAGPAAVLWLGAALAAVTAVVLVARRGTAPSGV